MNSCINLSTFLGKLAQEVKCYLRDEAFTTKWGLIWDALYPEWQLLTTEHPSAGRIQSECLHHVPVDGYLHWMDSLHCTWKLEFDFSKTFPGFAFVPPNTHHNWAYKVPCVFNSVFFFQVPKFLLDVEQTSGCGDHFIRQWFPTTNLSWNERNVFLIVSSLRLDGLHI